MKPELKSKMLHLRKYGVLLSLLFSLANNSLYSQLTLYLQSENPSCGGFSNGSVTAIVSGGTLPYQYIWNTGATTPSIEDLPAGYYAVTVTDANNYSVSSNVTLTSPPAISGNATGTCSVPGTVTANVWGGTPPYNYSWSNGVTGTSVITNLSPGQYCATVLDANTCGVVVCANVGWPPNVTVTTTDAGCSGGSGSATAFPSGGNPPYSYSWSNGGTSQTINNLPPGSYTVTITDEFGCTSSSSGTVGNSGGSFSVWLSSIPPTCNGNNGSITASAMGGIQPYTYQWSNGQSGATITGLGPGTYSVTVTDATGCISVKSITLDSSSDLTIDAEITNILCYGESTGSILGSGWGGTPPYTYLWNTGATTAGIYNLSAGQYTLTVTDFEGCTAVEYITITEPPALNVNISSADAGCGSGYNGSASASVWGGTPPYSYQWSNGQNTSTILNLGPGNYSLTVTDNNGCTITGSVYIILQGDLDVSTSINNLSCYGSNDGTASAIVSNGNPPFYYQWNTGATSQTILNISAGLYTVTVTDNAGCSGTAEAWISEPMPIILDIYSTPTLCGGAMNGTASVSASGGTSPYTYLWNTGSTNSTIFNLGPGTYTVTVTDWEGCTAVATTTIEGSGDFTIDVASQDVLCYGENSGSVLVSGWGGVPPYSYLWNTGATMPNLTGLSAGLYTVTVTDAIGCSIAENIVISEPPNLTLYINSIDAGCDGNTGSATAIAGGGTPPYSYLWSNGSTSSSINNLSPGFYSVTVQDANYCNISASVTIEGGVGLNMNISGNNVTCYGFNNGFAMAIPIGGNPPFQYLWNTGSTNSSITNIGAGQYSVTITDVQGCTASDLIWIDEPPAIVLNVSSTDEDCQASNNGSASAIASGGTPGYFYQWNNGSNSAVITNLSPGVYSVTVTDMNGCIKTGSTTVNQGGNLNLNISSNNIDCYGENSGTIQVFASGGSPPYNYNWNTGSNSSSLFNLGSGLYQVTVTDQNGCSGTEEVWITEPPLLLANLSVIDPDCSNTENGSITAIVSGGTSPYSYSWSNGATTQTINNLGAGSYSLTITDSNNCYKTVSVTLTSPPPIYLDIIGENYCEGDSGQGSATAVVSGGVGGYSYNWSNGGINATIFSLSQGTYFLTVTDNNGCSAQGSVYIDEYDKPSCSAYVVNPISQSGGNDGSVSVTASGGQAPYTYNWSNGQNSQTISNLSAGVYTVTVSDLNGCSSTCSVELTEPGPCENFTDPGSICCDQTLCGPGVDPDPIIEINPPSGGSGNIEIIWMMNTVAGPFDPNVWTIIPGANGTTYDPGPLYETTFFARCVRRDGCTLFLESNIITVTVLNVAIAEINGNDYACFGEPESFSATSSGPGSTYEWTFEDGNPATAVGPTVDNVVWTSFGSKTVTLNVTKNGCVSTDIHEIIVTNSPIWCSSPFGIQVNTINQNLVEVSWEYEGDENFTFKVERSKDSLNFETIGELESSVNPTFEFYDENPLRGKSFYRVKMLDEGGEFVNSNMEEVNLISKLGTAFVYPNPLNDGNLYVEIINDYNASDIKLELYDVKGVLQQEYELNPDKFRFEIQGDQFASGMYFLILKLNGKVQRTLKFVKL